VGWGKGIHKNLGGQGGAEQEEKRRGERTREEEKRRENKRRREEEREQEKNERRFGHLGSRYGGVEMKVDNYLTDYLGWSCAQ